jgi:hypothetical protein
MVVVKRPLDIGNRIRLRALLLTVPPAEVLPRLGVSPLLADQVARGERLTLGELAGIVAGLDAWEGGADA